MNNIQTNLFHNPQVDNNKSCQLENFVSLPVITLWQPWASFISLGWKTIETRTHKKFECLLFNKIGIHAGNKWDKDWQELAGDYLDSTQIRYTQNEINFGFLIGAWKGKILCTTQVIDFYRLTSSNSKKALIDCRHEAGRYGLFLDYIKPIQPIPVKGRQGIWYYSTEAS